MKPFGIVTNIAVEFYQVAYRTCCPNKSQPILVPVRGPVPGAVAGAALALVDACSWLGQWDGYWLLGPAWLLPWGAATVPDTPLVKHTGVRPVLPLLCRKGTNKVTQHKLPEMSKRDENSVHLQSHAPRQPSPLFVAQQPFPAQWQYWWSQLSLDLSREIF